MNTWRLLAIAIGLVGCAVAWMHTHPVAAPKSVPLAAEDQDGERSRRTAAFRLGVLAGSMCSLAVVNQSYDVAVRDNHACNLTFSDQPYDEIHEELAKLVVE